LVQLRLDPQGLQELTRQLGTTADVHASMLESQHVRVTHAHCAAVIFAEWNLPPNLVASAQFHHNPEAAPEDHAEIAALVHIADYLGRSAEMGFAFEPAGEPVSRAAMNLIGLADEDLDLIRAELPERVQALQQSLNTA
jgi:HD-like signal output (HDOD) protein